MIVSNRTYVAPAGRQSEFSRTRVATWRSLLQKAQCLTARSISPTELGDAEIALDSMAHYYSSLLEIDIESWKATAEELADTDKAEILTESKRKIEADEVIPWEEVKQEFDIRLR